jgi:phosphohistidine phosphatase
MEIWLLRHAAAEETSESGKDSDRRLTAEGEKRARAVARGLAALDPGIERVLTSPYRRARQTADPAARELGLERGLAETRALEPGRDPQEILEEIRSEEAEGWLLVGHEPHLGALLGRLVAGRPLLTIPLKKAAVARLDWDGTGPAELRALLPARVLEKLGARSA